MNVSYRWLSEYIDLSGIAPQELAEMLTRGGIEIDNVPSRNQGVSKVVVGYVKTREKHPDADKLSVCTVDAGQAEELQIVCGAPNVAAGQKVPVALVGAKLPSGLDIKRAKLRGVESQGMICSARELGINEKLLPKEQQEGILVLPEDTQVGAEILDVLTLDDAVLELDLTPNRSDCLSMLGVAYETSALTGRPVKLPDPERELFKSADKTSDHVSVAVHAPELCSHYSARYIKGVKIGPSPLWMQNRLIAAGIRPISNIVDVTNYVMLEYGQPLHAFDAAKVAGGRIEVRLAREGETLETLDGQVRKLAPDMLVIADADKAIALAGVMGGANSEVSAATTDIILESAKFSGSSVRKTSRLLGLRSEASARFEKEVDPGRVVPALDRAAALMASLAGGHVAEGVAEALARKPEPAVIEITLGRINGMLGTSLSALEVQTLFARLEFGAESPEDGKWRVTVPTRRGDITRSVDLVEEVARLYGYDDIPTTPIEGPTTTGALTREQAIRRELRSVMTHAGLHEAISYSVTSPERAGLFAELSQEAKPIALAMPMSEERSVLRTVLLPSLLDAAAYNLTRKNNDVALFEIGSVYHTDEATLTRLPREKPRLALLLTGSLTPAGWNRKAEPADFYDAKGLLEAVFLRLGLADAVTYEPARPEGFHPGRTAAVLLQTERGPITIGYVGQLHPDLQRSFDLPDAFVAEIELEAVYGKADPRIEYRTLPRYPSVERDLAVVVDRDARGASLTEAIRKAAGELLESVSIFDVYTGERLGPDKKSVAVAMVYRHGDRTLTDEEVSEAHARVLAELEHSFGAELRK
ncbi:phenylalanine--tRNA ligase subunit beta [Cohnella sp. CFH 77786]|uniref:phenylalanine--tRNA ligase subunit beta n=1 Tax=Cohnella sp. CFH 77786 TaxID=2662265 RepID=UPI001C609EEB|nr:phenylalanine--tRNA ligase subunit beta [Cohnella sp. CFH 77786]MBW5446958.1 phenylalanine--tRNA ligase subunit beta [Cohnella sp. CFH 77786]